MSHVVTMLILIWYLGFVLQEYFGKFGRIENCQLVYDRQSGRSRGFAFVHYEELDDAIEVDRLIHSSVQFLLECVCCGLYSVLRVSAVND